MNLKIRRLDEAVINQIKAGEVIERPASVVKELFENAVDAGSSEVTVEILDGGKQLIRVTDNGTGMEQDDLMLALDRHATSKLVEASDLDAISTFGFRGEALPSVAAVSTFAMRSRMAHMALGNELTVSDRLQKSTSEVAMPEGTSVTVKDLFLKVPARQKFLKATATEFSHIQEYLFAMALAYPNVGLKLLHNGREVLSVPAGQTLKRRFETLLQNDAQEFVPVQFKRGTFEISGFAGLPESAKTLPRYFMTFVNGRLVKDRILRAGILQAYTGLVMKGLLPSAVLFVSVDAQAIDVNAHPAKTEVRFYDAAVVQDLVSIGVQNSVKKAVSARMMNAGGVAKQEQALKPHPTSAQSSQATLHTTSHTTSHGYKPSSAGGSPITNAHATQGVRYNRAENIANQRMDSSVFRESAPASRDRGLIEKPARGESLLGNDTAALDDTAARRDVPPREKPEVLFDAQPLQGPFAQARYLGQYLNCYLLLETQSELLVVDQHAFHERVLFEEFMRSHESQKVPLQQMLTPLLVPMPRSMAPVVFEAHAQLRELGFEIELLTNETIAVHAYPAFLQADRVASVFDEVVARVLVLSDVSTSDVHPLLVKASQAKDQMTTLGQHARSLAGRDVFHLFFATMACHAAVRAGDPLSPELVRRLLARAGDVDFYAHCPHGRPVYRRFLESDVAQWFCRI